MLVGQLPWSAASRAKDKVTVAHTKESMRAGGALTLWVVQRLEECALEQAAARQQQQGSNLVMISRHGVACINNIIEHLEVGLAMRNIAL
jgi:hypothetical protein